MKNARCGIHGLDGITIFEGRIPIPSKKDLIKAYIRFRVKNEESIDPLPEIELITFRPPKKNEYIFKIDLFPGDGEISKMCIDLYPIPVWILKITNNAKTKQRPIKRTCR